MKVYAVIDTNVIVSAMLTRKAFSATTQVFEAFQSGDIILLYNEEIFAEYRDVLSRSKFNFPSERVQALLDFIEEEGIVSSRVKNSEFFPDPKDVVFYEVALSKEDAPPLRFGGILHPQREPSPPSSEGCSPSPQNCTSILKVYKNEKTGCAIRGWVAQPCL